MPHADGKSASPLTGISKATWGRAFGGTRPASVAAGVGLYVGTGVDAADTLKFGAKTLTAASGAKITAVVAGLDTNHDPMWTDGLETTTTETVYPVVRASGDSVAVGFVASGSATLGGTTLDLGATKTLVVAFLDGTGHATWMKPVGKIGSKFSNLELGTGGSGNLYGAVSFESGETVGGQTFDCDFTLFSLAPTGSFRYARCVSPAPGSIYSIDALAVDGIGNVYLAGYPKPGLDVGTGLLSIENSAGASFVAKVGPDSKTVWAKALLRAYASTLVVTSGGTLFMSGDMPQQDARNGLIEIDGHAYLPCDDGFRTHITRVAPDGTVEWSRAWGARPELLAVSDQYDLLFSAGVLDAPEVATGAKTTDTPPFLGVVGPSGALSWLDSLAPPGSTGQNSVREAAPLAGGGFVVGGTIGEQLTLGSDVLTGAVGGSTLVFGVGK